MSIRRSLLASFASPLALGSAPRFTATPHLPAARLIHASIARSEKEAGPVKTVYDLLLGPHASAQSPPTSSSASSNAPAALRGLPSPPNRPQTYQRKSLFQAFLGKGDGRDGRGRHQGSVDLEAERQSRERNLETAKALERTLRSSRGTAMSGGAAGAGMDVRCTTLDAKGVVSSMVAHVPKDELCRRFAIQPRDLRKLDSGVPTSVPTILSRRECIIFTVLHLRVVITANEVTIFDSIGAEDSYLRGIFVWSLEHALKTTSKTAHGLPYEFRALEACLINVITALEMDLANVRSHVVELLGHMEEHIDRDNLRLLLHYSRKLSVFQKRATLVQECLDELLANDDDLAGMYLTARMHGTPHAANDHEAIELLLESFSKQCEEIVSEVETLEANVKHTEDIIELILDSNRNSLLGLDLRVSIATLGLTAGAMIAALFGMNLTSYLETHPFAFPAVSLFAFASAAFVTAIGLRRLARLRRVNLGWREELRQVAADKWERRRRGSRRRD
ncbi:hypothetical protein NBRC10512_002770 [Rhodotorula toruloides]|uniref:Magnesium transporter n=2 Tax=Rhodotorula toruloides TaxID=5286 RepID=A0A061B8T4_RHOTO|nr:magnesium ion transporter [Rhodotorula toruloides NP11]EMS21590.1 magnesium ion transporter [Rhodotorula toruloides NP11]CDR45784.1 RHTO0S11e04852g1_1 [Rhodotorula toruloides]